jgi:hypothetical protein
VERKKKRKRSEEEGAAGKSGIDKSNDKWGMF